MPFREAKLPPGPPIEQDHMKILTDRFDRKIRLTEERNAHILARTEMRGQEKKIIETIMGPEIVRHSIWDKDVHLYYKFYRKTPVTQKYLLVAVKVFNDEGFIITAFFTDRIKEGEVLWKKE